MRLHHWFFDIIFHGTNSRIFNAPIDLFIEDHIFNSFPDLRPQQFLSLLNIEKLSLQAVTDPSIVSLTPASIISRIKVYNVISSRQFDELFGTETEKEYPLSKQEKEQVEALWSEFNEYRKDKEPGEEYELIQNWAEDLELTPYFKLVPDKYKGAEDTDLVPEDVAKTPMNPEGLTDKERDELNKFIRNNASENINPEIVAYMVEAMKLMGDFSEDKLEEIAFETAMLAKGGISPKKSGLHLKSITGKEFNGLEVLSYYYVAWAKYKPEYVAELGLDYGKEYAAASSLSKI